MDVFSIEKVVTFYAELLMQRYHEVSSRYMPSAPPNCHW